MWQDKNAKKKRSKEKSCWKDLWQRNYLNSWTKGTIKNTEVDQRGIGNSEKGNEQERKE